MGRYYGSEAMRNPKLQKKAIDFALDRLNPMIQNVGSQALDQLSTKIRPKKKYKTNRKDLDGAGIIDKALTSGVLGSPWHVDIKKGFQLLTDPTLFKEPKLSKKQMIENVKHYKELYKQAKENGYKGSYTKFVKEIGVATRPTFTFPWFGGALYRRKPTITDKIAEGAAMFVNPTASWTGALKLLGSQGLKGITDNVKHYKGSGVDIHKIIGKLPKPKSGWTLPGHKYTGPYNDLDSQVRFDPITGEILEVFDQPTGKTDAIAMQHDVDYSVCKDNRKCKNEADRKMVKALDSIPFHKRQWGHTVARNIINTKQKLGLGAKQRKTKNVKRRLVKKK